MTLLHGAEEDRFLAPGTKVRLSILVDRSDYLEPDFGVVVHCWRAKLRDKFDCYVAFFGERFPNGEPPEELYLLRHAASSLAVAE